MAADEVEIVDTIDIANGVALGLILYDAASQSIWQMSLFVVFALAVWFIRKREKES